MVDVGAKPAVRRRAVARAVVKLLPETATRLRDLPKGDALATAQLAGIMAAKRTSELIPLCHPLPLTHIEVSLELVGSTVEILAAAETTAQTGVEMEALDGGLRGGPDRLRHGEGGRQADELRGVAGGKGEGMNAAVLTVSDRVSRGEAEDGSGDLLAERLRADGYDGRTARGRRRGRRDRCGDRGARVRGRGRTDDGRHRTRPCATSLPRRPARCCSARLRGSPRRCGRIRRGRRRTGCCRAGRRASIGKTLVVEPAGLDRRVPRRLRGSAARARARAGAARGRPDRARADMTDSTLAALPVRYARLVKIEHTLFALPFAYVGAFLVGRRRPVGARPALGDGRDGRRPLAGDGAEPADRCADRCVESAHRDARDSRPACSGSVPWSRSASAPWRSSWSRSGSSTRSSAGCGRSRCSHSSSTRISSGSPGSATSGWAPSTAWRRSGRGRRFAATCPGRRGRSAAPLRRGWRASTSSTRSSTSRSTANRACTRGRFVSASAGASPGRARCTC